MKKRLIFFSILFFIVISTHSQVNLQTGSATFSLPMFSWQDDKSRLNSIVALSYNSGNGLKVNDVASNVGQGWSLISGGEIVRMQVGEPDDQYPRDGNNDDITKYPAGILYATIPASNGCPNALTKYPIYGWQNQIYTQHNKIAEDKQPDYFSFQFNGKAGMFILDPANMGAAISLGDSKMKINFLVDSNLISQGIRTRITSFIVQDIDGLIYKFSRHGLTKVLKTSYCDEQFNYIQTQPKFKDGKIYYQSSFEDHQIVNPWIIGSWQLTEIEDALTHRKIFFNYENAPRNINTTAGQDISANHSKNDYCIISHKRSVTKTPAIESVTYPDGHSVKINYGRERVDLIGEKVISSVDITYKERFLSKYVLNTTYFILNRYGAPLTDYQKNVSRLSLQSVKKIGVDLKEDTPPYIFDYYIGSNLPDDFVPPPFSYAKDIWGFYNGDSSKGYWRETIPLTNSVSQIKNTNQLRGLCYMRNDVSGVHLNAKPGYAKNGLLKQIIYPTGGTLTYDYDQNTGVINGVNNNVGGVHVVQTSSTDGGFSNGCVNPIVTNYNYVIEGAGSQSSLWGLETPVNEIVSNNHYQPEYKSYKWTLKNAPFGSCYWRFQYPGILSQQQAISITDGQKFMEAVSPVLGIFSVVGTIQDIVAAFSGSPAALIIDVIIGLIEIGITCIGDQAKDRTAIIHFNSDLNAAAPLPLQFKRVEVIESPGTIGKTIQEFTSNDDYPVWEPVNPVFSSKQRFASWAYGLPKKTIVLDANGNKIKETINNYDTAFTKNLINPCGLKSQCNSTGIRSTLISCKCEVVTNSSLRNTLWTDPATHNPTYLKTSSPGIMKVDFYGMYSGRTLLANTSERIYKPADPSQFVETVTSYRYNSIGNYEPYLIETKQSNGDINNKNITYSSSYYGGALNILVQNNIVALPVATSTTVIKAGEPMKYLSEKVTEFEQLPNGDIKPSRILEQRFDNPVPVNNFTRYDGPGNSIYNYKIPQTFLYDASGNLIGLKDEGGRTVTNIYDYNDKYVVASVINADPAGDKPAYTSFETSSFGNWILTGTATYLSANAVTGNKSLSLFTDNALTSPSLNNTKSYKVTFWATAPVPVGPDATLSKSYPTINGFTYYEYEIAAGNSSIVVGGSNSIIDELRIYPATSRMRTLTYDPLIGKTSECDENNRITYYEYDNLGRLQFIKDEYKNIIKMHEYNNVSAAKQNGCPGSYFNHFFSEVFIKNNCSNGYRGDTVIYTVAANIYSSNISQADADAQAEYYLLTNGQAFANTNGGCKLLYYNAAISIKDTTASCAIGYIGGPVTYTVPAGRYSSVFSQAEANEKAIDDLDANAAAYINNPEHRVCTIDSNPNWAGLENATTICQLVNGYNHLFLQQTNINPNSSTYNQTRWYDIGPQDACPNECNSNNCQESLGGKCINGVCEMGVRVATMSYYATGNICGCYVCVYHYEFSDGSWSSDYEHFDVDPCM